MCHVDDWVRRAIVLHHRLDKPMRNHTLMQTIARANRVWRDKQNGLIVDYVGIFRDLQKALAIYGMAQGGAEPGETPITAIHPRIIKGTLWLTKRQQPGSDQLWIRLHIPEDAGQSGEQFPWAGEVAIMGSIFACVLPQPFGGIELR